MIVACFCVRFFANGVSSRCTFDDDPFKMIHHELPPFPCIEPLFVVII